MPTQAEKAFTFRDLHDGDSAFLIPNPWDVGSAQVLTGLGAKALATTSAGHAFTIGKFDMTGGVTRDEALAHARAVAECTPLPVSGDFENGYGGSPDAVADTVRAALAAGLAGCSIEDTTMERAPLSYDFETAVQRVKAAVDVARSVAFPFQLCARADGLLSGAYDVDEAIRRLQAFEAVGADVLFAPLLPDIEALRKLCSSLSKPVNAIAAGALAQYTIAELSAAGARRVSTGSGLFNIAADAFHNAASRMLETGEMSAIAAIKSQGRILKARRAFPPES